MGEKYKVAVASSDGETVDSHFGHTENFLVFEVDEESGKFEQIESRNVTAGCKGGECGNDTENEKASPLEQVAESLKDTDYVLAARIGPHAQRLLALHDVTSFGIVISIEEGIKKINDFRKKLKERKTRAWESQS